MLKNEVDFMKKICSSLLLLFVSLIFLFSCSDNSSDGGNDGSGSAQEPEKTYHKVMVGVGEGFTVTSKNPIDVEEGSDAVFDIAISPTHSFVSVSDGVYLLAAQPLKISGADGSPTRAILIDGII